MKTISTLIKLQFRAGVRLISRDKTLGKTIGKWILISLVALVLMAGFIAIYYMLATQFTVIEAGIDLTVEFLTFSIVGFMAIQTIFLIPMLIKVLDINNDREILLKFPISSKQIFISKIIVVYCFELLFALAILAPILIAYGIAINAAWWFYLIIPLFILFVPVFPFFLAIMAFFPVLKVTLWIKNKSSLTTLSYLLLLIAAVVLYMLMVQSFVKDVAYGGLGAMLHDNADTIIRVATFLYPAKAFARLTYGTVVAGFINFGIIMALTIVLLAIAIFIANIKYKGLYMKEHGMISSFKSKGDYKGNNATRAAIVKDCRNIFRSSNYTFQFLLVVTIIPLLIFFSNRIANYAMYQSLHSTLGGIAMGSLAHGISFEISVFITIVLVPLAASFAASNISREGYNIYHTKLIPVAYRKQLFIKTAIVFIPIFVAILIGSLLSMINHSISYGEDPLSGLAGSEVVMLLFIAAFLTIGYISLGTYFDIRKPLCSQIGAGELTKPTGHANFIILLGVAIGIGFGSLGMLSAFAQEIEFGLSTDAFRWILLAFSFVFGAVFTITLFVDGPRRYNQIEQ
ncbi:MAG: hypothetical protein FWE03_05175 [Firmicutes bacterium]|nr:hypothetical protein [Bacillota bacterium]